MLLMLVQVKSVLHPLVVSPQFLRLVLQSFWDDIEHNDILFLQESQPCMTCHRSYVPLCPFPNPWSGLGRFYSYYIACLELLGIFCVAIIVTCLCFLSFLGLCCFSSALGTSGHGIPSLVGKNVLVRRLIALGYSSDREEPYRYLCCCLVSCLVVALLPSQQPRLFHLLCVPGLIVPWLNSHTLAKSENAWQANCGSLSLITVSGQPTYLAKWHFSLVVTGGAVVAERLSMSIQRNWYNSLLWVTPCLCMWTR